MSILNKIFRKNMPAPSRELSDNDIKNALSGCMDAFLKNGKSELSLSRDEIAELLKISPDALDAFEKAYYDNVLLKQRTDNYFETNAKQASKSLVHLESCENKELDGIISRIVNELLCQTSVYSYDGNESSVTVFDSKVSDESMVTAEEVKAIKEEIRPQLTGVLYKKDIPGNSSDALLYMYKMWKESENKETSQHAYHKFRQGLDILDLDPLMYEIIGTNPTSMGYWLPPLVNAVKKQGFFKIPKTSILKVPFTMLQLTRQEYSMLTPTTLRIVDLFCEKAFNLDENGNYFLKTGTYSSKFDFRNAHVHDPKEVHEIGEYLLYIHFQALMHASPLCNPCIYGMSTTNEWVVREFIEDKENNPCIYKGLPLHTEYRIFVDFDTDEILGISPYWRPDVMKKRFGHMDDADSPHQRHDYVIYASHEEKLMSRYNSNKDMVLQHMAEMIKDVNIPGQWSVDIMQNGDDFYIIDMATAHTSALNDCVPKGKLSMPEEDWMPKISQI